MRKLRLQIDISGTTGNEAWESLRHFSEIQSSRCSPEEGSSGSCLHEPNAPHPAGEWRGAVVILESFLAEYALPHYLKQARVIDAYIDADTGETNR